MQRLDLKFNFGKTQAVDYTSWDNISSTRLHGKDCVYVLEMFVLVCNITVANVKLADVAPGFELMLASLLTLASVS